MKSSFTKAPWSKAYIEAVFRSATKHISPEDLLLGSDIRCLNRGDVHLPEPHRVPMDLRLMAHGPAMYEALATAAAVLSAYDPDDELNDRINTALAAIRAVLREVEGAKQTEVIHG